MKLFKSAALVAFLAVPVIATAQSTEDVMEARHGFMRMLALNMGQLSGMAKGEIEYDEAAAATAAANIEALTQYTATGLFVPGTSSEDLENSGALPAVWDNSEKFAQEFQSFAEAATGASEGVKGGQGNIGPVLQKLGGSCKSCHDDFRKPE
ncbi:cytochrome c [Paracoccus sp. Z330]|uniref:Cytochrome c n=1 Tax=Paracoccus onchidii TaxID=3017813 RepID=A0ABT4ZIL3_9RHOB|nr:cytochrome c [Paracoccus onchidii]MDB6178575.1 cytochrome c [Paracoccus onchidii]